MKLYLSANIRAKLKEIVYATKVETGACLFGTKDREGNFQVAHLAGPGKRAKHLSWHYEGDHEHYENVYNELLKSDGNLKHLGELHVHPPGMPELSRGDLRTVKKVLKRYEEFIAGVILRKRTPDLRRAMLGLAGSRLYEKGLREMSIYPVYFSREKPEGENLELVIE